MHFKNLKKTEDNYDLRLEGESYNWKEIANSVSITASNFSDLLLKSYKSNKLNLVLNKIDGYFCGSIYDKINRKVVLFSDRWGMRFLYYYNDGENFAWASEIKGLLVLPFLKRDIDENSINCFIDVGYLLNDNTFFKNIKLLKQATCLTYNIINKSSFQEYYWKWSDIHKSNITYQKAVYQLAELLPLAVIRRFNQEEKIGIPLRHIIQ